MQNTKKLAICSWQLARRQDNKITRYKILEDKIRPSTDGDERQKNTNSE